MCCITGIQIELNIDSDKCNFKHMLRHDYVRANYF